MQSCALDHIIINLLPSHERFVYRSVTPYVKLSFFQVQLHPRSTRSSYTLFSPQAGLCEDNSDHSRYESSMKCTVFFLALVVTALGAPQRHRRPNGTNQPFPGALDTNKPAPSAPDTNQPAPSVPGTNVPPTNAPTPNTGGTIDPSLVPDFGITPGIPSTNQPGSCQGNNNVNIPCDCPPSKADFIDVLEKFNARGNIFGSPFNFDTNTADRSPATQLSRVSAAIVALQNFDDASIGQGCPAGGSAPNFLAVQAQLRNEA